MKVRLSFLVIASLVSLATSQSETAVRPVVSMAIVDGKDSDMGEKQVIHMRTVTCQPVQSPY